MRCWLLLYSLSLNCMWEMLYFRVCECVRACVILEKNSWLPEALWAQPARCTSINSLEELSPWPRMDAVRPPVPPPRTYTLHCSMKRLFNWEVLRIWWSDGAFSVAQWSFFGEGADWEAQLTFGGIMAAEVSLSSGSSDTSSTGEEERVKRLFQTCDGDGDGYISR